MALTNMTKHLVFSKMTNGLDRCNKSDINVNKKRLLLPQHFFVAHSTFLYLPFINTIIQFLFDLAAINHQIKACSNTFFPVVVAVSFDLLDLLDFGRVIRTDLFSKNWAIRLVLAGCRKLYQKKTKCSLFNFSCYDSQWNGVVSHTTSNHI